MKKLTTEQRNKVKRFIKRLNEDTPSISSLIKNFRYMNNDEMIFLLNSMATYFKSNAEELTNMNALQISKHLTSAAKLISLRTGN